MSINPKQARRQLGLNQTDMARAMGVASSTWLNWEREGRDITAGPERLIETLL